MYYILIKSSNVHIWKIKKTVYDYFFYYLEIYIYLYIFISYCILFTLPSTENYFDQPKRVFTYVVRRGTYYRYIRYIVYGWLFLENNDSVQCFFFIFFIQFCPDNFTLCVLVRDRHLLKTCFQHFIRVDESWKGLALVSVQLPCRVKSYQTYISIYTHHAHVLSFETLLSLSKLILYFYQVQPNLSKSMF
jgi:hypothetical protein